jgi:hypothetical protein
VQLIAWLEPKVDEAKLPPQNRELAAVVAYSPIHPIVEFPEVVIKELLTNVAVNLLVIEG